MDMLSELPVELTNTILSYLTADELHNCRLVSYSFSAGEGEDDEGRCPTMKKYLAGRQTRLNWLQGKYKDVCEVEIGDMVVRRIGDGGWLLDEGVYTRSGHTFPVPPALATIHEPHVVLSADSLYLATSHNRCAFLFERPALDAGFVLSRAFALSRDRGQGAESERSWGRIITICPRPGHSLEFLDRFISENRAETGSFRCLFTGFDTPAGRRLSLRTGHGVSAIALWDIHRRRMARYWETDTWIVEVQEGWDRRGICVEYDRRVDFHDLDGQLLQTIDLRARRWTIRQLHVMMDVSAVALIVEDGESESLKVAVWEKQGSNEPRAVGAIRLDCNNQCYRLVDSASASLAYVSAGDSIVILAAPDWHQAALIRISPADCKGFHFIDFADSFGLLIVGNERGEVVGYDVDLAKRGAETSEGRLIGSLAGASIISINSRQVVLFDRSTRKLVFRTYAD